jgi:hypothetical protein
MSFTFAQYFFLKIKKSIIYNITWWATPFSLSLFDKNIFARVCTFSYVNSESLDEVLTVPTPDHTKV